jgi:hypothetical protein
VYALCMCCCLPREGLRICPHDHRITLTGQSQSRVEVTMVITRYFIWSVNCKGILIYWIFWITLFIVSSIKTSDAFPKLIPNTVITSYFWVGRILPPDYQFEPCSYLTVPDYICAVSDS